VVAHLFLECGLHDRLRQAREQATPADQLHTLGTRMVDQFLSKLLLVNVSRPWARSSRSVLVLSAKQRSACPGQLHRSPDSASESFQASVSVSKRKMYGGILRVMGLRISRRLSWVTRLVCFRRCWWGARCRCPRWAIGAAGRPEDQVRQTLPMCFR
jgi:hypothetical protein